MGVALPVSGRGSASAPQRSANLAALGFSPSAARRQQNLARFVERSNGDTALRQFSAQSGQIFPQLQALLATYGLDANNVADAYTVWWISAWDAAHGQTGTRPKSTYQAVRAQSAQALLSTSGFDPRDDAQKQEMAEALLVQAVFIDVGVEQAAGDPEQLRAIGNAVAQGARAMGLDLSAITLTSNGFQRK